MRRHAILAALTALVSDVRQETQQELRTNASLLAWQCDMAREAETAQAKAEAALAKMTQERQEEIAKLTFGLQGAHQLENLLAKKAEDERQRANDAEAALAAAHARIDALEAAMNPQDVCDVDTALRALAGGSQASQTRIAFGPDLSVEGKP